MAIMTRVILRCLKRTLLALLAAVVAVDIYCEVFGLPAVALEYFHAELRERGVWLDAEALRVGLVRGLSVRAVTVWDGYLPGVRLFRAAEVRARLDVVRLARGELVLKRFLVIGAEGYLPSASEPTQAPPLLTMERVTARGCYRNHVLQIDELTGALEGVEVRIAGFVSERRPKPPSGRSHPRATTTAAERDERPRRREWRLSLLPTLRQISAAGERHVFEIARVLRSQRRQGSARIDARVILFSHQWQRNAVSGSCDLPAARLRGVGVRRLTGDFLVTQNRLDLHNVQVSSERGEWLRLDCTLRPRTKTLQAKAHGRLHPATVWRLCEQNPPPGLSDVAMSNPVTFSAVLRPSPTDPRLWRADLECSAGPFLVRDLEVRHAEAAGVLEDGVLQIAEASLRFGPDAGGGELRGQVSLHPWASRLSLHAEGTCVPLRLVRQLGVPVPEPLDGLGGDGPSVNLTLAVDNSPYRPDRWSGSGRFQTESFSYLGSSLKQVDGRFTFAPGTVDLTDLQAELDGESREHVAGRLRLGSPAGALALELSGALFPKTVAGLLQRPPPTLTTIADAVETTGAPPSFRCLATRALMSPGAWSWTGELDVDARRLRVRRLAIPRAEVRIDFAPGRISIKPIVRLTENADASVKGTVELATHRKRMRATASGPLMLGRVCGELELGAMPWIDRIELTGAPADVSFELHDSDWAPRGWTGSATVAAKDVRIGRQLIDSLTCAIEFAPGRVVLRPEFRAQTGAVQQRVGAHVTLDTESKRIRADASGACVVDDVCEAVGLPSEPFLRTVDLHGEPVVFSARLHESPWSPDTWSVEARVVAAGAEYDGLPVRRFEGTLRYGPERWGLDVDSAEVGKGTRLSLTLDCDRHSGELRLAGWWHGDPALAARFIPPGEGRDGYAKVWQGVTWGHPAQPVIRIEELHSYKADDRWRLDLNGTLTADDVRWRGIHADSVTADVKLALPDSIRVTNAAIVRGDSKLEGEADIRPAGPSPFCRFAAHGSLDPLNDLAPAMPSWRTFLEFVALDPLTLVRCEGTVPLKRGEEGVDVGGTIESPKAAWWGLGLQDVNLEWHLSDELLRVGPLSVSTCGGSVSGNGSCRLEEQTGSLSLRLDHIDVSECVKQLNGKDQGRRLGVLDGTVELGSIRKPQDAALELRGNGRATVRGGDLWEIPFLHGLGDLVYGYVAMIARATKIDGLAKLTRALTLGSLSQLEADVEFVGDRLRVPSFSTDGTILALRGTGEYAWGPRTFEVAVRGVPLERTRLIPWVWEKISWFSVEGARCSGTVGKYHWRPISRLDNVFPKSEQHRQPDPGADGRDDE